MKSGLKKTLLFTGAAAAAGALIYYLFRDDDDEDENVDSEVDGSSLYPNDLGGGHRASRGASMMTRNECLALLSKIVTSQNQARQLMDSTVQSIIENGFKESLYELYKRILPSVPLDPLEQQGLTLFDLDYLVERYQKDPTVREYIIKIMNVNTDAPDDDSDKLTVEQILEIHELMLEHVQRSVAEFRSIPNYESLDRKVLTVAVQAVVSAKVVEKYGVDHTVLDRAIVHHHGELSMNQHFTRLTMQMQTEMAELTGLFN